MLTLSRRRVLAALGVLPAALALPGAGLHAERFDDQGLLADGRLVVRGDGTIYLVESGTKRLVYPLRGVDDEEINALPDGEPVVLLAGQSESAAPSGASAGSTLTPASVVVQGSGAAPSVSLPGDSGPTALIGQRVLTKGSNDQPIAATVVDTRWLDTYPGTHGTMYAAGVFAMLLLEVSNEGRASSYCGAYSLQLIDDRNRRYDASRLYVASATERAWGFPEGTNPRVNPGLKKRSLLAFDVPPETKRFTLVPFKR